MAKTISMNGRKKIETIQKEFSSKFPYLTLVFLNENRMPLAGHKTLAEVRGTKGPDLSIMATLKVNSLEQSFKDSFGLTVEVAYAQNGKLIHSQESENKTLSELNKWCESHRCENFSSKKSPAPQPSPNHQDQPQSLGNTDSKTATKSSDFVTEEDVAQKCSQFYGDNFWEREEYVLNKRPFPNVIRNRNDLEVIFRKFTQKEVNLIVKKIKQKGCYLFLPFIKDILGREIDMSSMKPPLWFIPHVAYGNDIASFFYFEENGIYTYVHPGQLTLVAHVDTWNTLGVEPGYNGLFNTHEDDDHLSSLKIDWHNPKSGNSGAINVVDFHGKEFASSLHIIKALWDFGWRKVVDRSRGGSQFFHDPTFEIEIFDSWDELIKWAGE